MKTISLLFCSVLIVLASPIGRAELVIPIVRGVDNPTQIAVVPFRYSGAVTLTEDIASIVAADLHRSGQFDAMDPADMLAFPSRPEDVVFRDWRLSGSEYLVVGSIQPVSSGLSATYSLYDVLSQRPIIYNKSLQTQFSGLRDLAHAISDDIYQAITGIRGAFSTKIIYVEHRSQASQPYRLILSDMDGARPQELFRSSEPLLSPEWSPNGQYVVYVSFETGRAAIFVQELATGKRQQVTNFTGLNGAPSWSPDGKKLALVLSKDGNAEIYILDLASRQLRRITQHFAIDTEPTWSTDGQRIIFTSNRGGKPQIYQVTLSSGDVERLSFEGDYNANAQTTPDGKGLVYVHRDQGVFHIVLQEIATGNMRILTRTQQDESPSIAPNGASLLYATKAGDKGILAGVSLDAGVRHTWPAKQGDVREPSWSPYFK
ncbi:MAG: Tol-Pal system beta propeller repeat protein TolB [Cellvibrionaceae bacterium]|nr:Tol-Pal system beta propeller repeat protein TolB [Cellvibrionaceae bacterium]